MPTFPAKFKRPSVVLQRAGHVGGLFAMILVRSEAKSLTVKNACRVVRSVRATISSEGEMAGFMVRSQLRKQRQTSAA